MKYLKYLFVIPLLSFFSCSDDLEDINEDLNYPTKVPINRLIMGIERDLSDEYAITSFDLTNKMVNYTEYPLKHWDHFLLVRDANEDWWEQHYDELANVDYIIRNAKKGQEDTKGVALVLKSWMYYVTSSLYGDLPYSEAGKAYNGINQPAYDTQDNIFNDILIMLDQANGLLGTGQFPLEGDFLLNNDVLKWKKFANSLKVRVLIAMSKQTDPSAELKKIINNPMVYPLMTSNDDQPAFSYNQVEPYARNKYGLFFVNDVYMGKDFIDMLLKFNDERVKMYAAKADVPTFGDYNGIPSSTTTNPSGTASKTSRLIFNSLTNHAIQTVWMNYAELQFLLAEAAERNWIDGGSVEAKKYYEEGIRASYQYQKDRLDKGVAIEPTDLEPGEVWDLEPMVDWNSNYLTQEGVLYTGTQSDKLNLIATQKWLALYLDLESYLSWRRTKRPLLNFDSSAVNNGVPPNRLRYPVNEKVLNNKNYQEAVARQGADSWDTKMWLLK
ncbi:MAG: SusD/RagB family nutrient-binding outer membrane lipoprotein [Carboxylicivirga sp.]|jgi:hypothetical protein|nr:SusD/RagB family nutrient-binding outer membrane lipoprotein [Carboxylicivirga sp.]